MNTRDRSKIVFVEEREAGGCEADNLTAICELIV
jgi:hypothetical protein